MSLHCNSSRGQSGQLENPVRLMHTCACVNVLIIIAFFFASCVLSSHSIITSHLLALPACLSCDRLHIISIGMTPHGCASHSACACRCANLLDAHSRTQCMQSSEQLSFRTNDHICTRTSEELNHEQANAFARE